MDGNRKTHKGSHTSEDDGGPPNHEENQQQASSDIISMEHLRRLVRLLDQSDVSELEVKRPEDGTRLVLRKVKAAEVNGSTPAAGFAKADSRDPYDIDAVPSLAITEAAARIVVTARGCNGGDVMARFRKTHRQIGQVLPSRNDVRIERLIQ